MCPLPFVIHSPQAGQNTWIHFIIGTPQGSRPSRPDDGDSPRRCDTRSARLPGRTHRTPSSELPRTAGAALIPARDAHPKGEGMEEVPMPAGLAVHSIPHTRTTGTLDSPVVCFHLVSAYLTFRHESPSPVAAVTSFRSAHSFWTMRKPKLLQSE